MPQGFKTESGGDGAQRESGPSSRGAPANPAFTVCCTALGRGVSGPGGCCSRGCACTLEAGGRHPGPRRRKLGHREAKQLTRGTRVESGRAGLQCALNTEIITIIVRTVTHTSGFGGPGACKVSEAYCFFNTGRTLSLNKFPTSGQPFSFFGQGLGISWLAIAGRCTQMVRDSPGFEVRCFAHGLSCKS